MFLLFITIIMHIQDKRSKVNGENERGVIRCNNNAYTNIIYIHRTER